MDENSKETLVKRVEREWADLRRLFRKNWILAAILVLIMLGYVAFQVGLLDFSHKGGNDTEGQTKVGVQRSKADKTTAPATQGPDSNNAAQGIGLALVNCQPLGTQDSVSVNVAHKGGPTITSFNTDGKEMVVPFSTFPKRIYVEPPGKTVSSFDLPLELTLGNCADKICKITIKKFVDNGVVVDTSSAFILTEKRETCGVQVKMTLLDVENMASPPAQNFGPEKNNSKNRRSTAQAQNPTVGNITQGPGSIAQIGGNGNTATINNLSSPARRLTDQEIDSLASCLRVKPGQFEIAAIANNSEAYRLAEDLSRVFKSAGWQDKAERIQIFMIGGGMWSGVRISIHGGWDADKKLAILNSESPEQQAASCLRGARIDGGGTIIPFPDLPSGKVRVEVSDYPSQSLPNQGQK